MLDPFSLSTGIASLMSLTASLTQTVLTFINDVRSFPEEFNKLLMEIINLHGVLSVIRPGVDRFGAGGKRVVSY